VADSGGHGDEINGFGRGKEALPNFQISQMTKFGRGIFDELREGGINGIFLEGECDTRFAFERVSVLGADPSTSLRSGRLTFKMKIFLKCV
jgi:hypothetical protein